MAKCIGKIRERDLFEHDYDRWRNHEDCSELIGYGVAYKFWRWLKNVDLIGFDETVDDVWENLSGVRDGNRYDIHDDYAICNYEEELYDTKIFINFLYVVNGNLWATLYDKANNTWYGDIEIPNI